MKILAIGTRVSVSTSTAGKRLGGAVKDRIYWNGEHIYVIDLDGGGETRSYFEDLEEMTESEVD